MVRILLHRFCAPSSAHEYFVANILPPHSCGSLCSRMSFEQQPYDNTLWLSFFWWVCANQFIHVWVESRDCSAQDCSNLAMSVHCVTLTRCSCRRHGKHFQRLRVCETIVPFVLTSPAHKISLFRWDRCQTPMISLNGLTFLLPSNHTGMLCNALASVSQLSGVMRMLATHQQSRSQNTSLPQLATSSLLAQLDVQQRSSNHQYRFQHCL